MIEPQPTYATPLQRVLREQGRKQRWLSEQVDVTVRDMSLIVKRGMIPPASTRTRIAQTLDVPETVLWPDVLPESEVAA